MTESIDPQLAAWLERVASELGVSAEAIPVADLLDVARDVAHGQVRPGAPTSTFFIGYAIGLWESQQLAAGSQPTLADRAAKVHELSLQIQKLALGE